MEDNFKTEIISPEKVIFSDDTKMVCYEISRKAR